MADVAYGQIQRSTTDRIDHALVRIEAALAARVVSGAALERRHASLRDSMAEAIAALDAMIGREQG